TASRRRFRRTLFHSLSREENGETKFAARRRQPHARGVCSLLNCIGPAWPDALKCAAPNFSRAPAPRSSVSEVRRSATLAIWVRTLFPPAIVSQCSQRSSNIQPQDRRDKRRPR